MKPFFLAGWLASALMTSLVWAAASDVLLQKAETAWQTRDQPGQTVEAINAWQAALQEDPQRGELYILLTKACGRAYRHSKTTQERRRWAEKAKEYGAQAVSRNPKHPEAYAEYGEALGQWAQAHKGVAGLRAVKKAVKNLEKAISLDPQYAYAHMLLAQFYHQAPSVISVGDDKKAFEHAKLAVTYGENYAINHITLAKVYLSRRQKAEARKELEKTLTLSPPADAIPETRSDQEDAREMLKDL